MTDSALVGTIGTIRLLGSRGGPLHCLDPRLDRLDCISHIHGCFRTGFGGQGIGDALQLLPTDRSDCGGRLNHTLAKADCRLGSERRLGTCGKKREQQVFQFHGWSPGF
ncbi:MAG TPA: hypothetical protein PKN09_12635, partial [Novosphingobium sp.]|nr:hypothetical protein [Novosphingobium sp.]